MRKSYLKTFIKKVIKNGFIGRFKTVNFSFAMIYIIDIILVLLQNNLNYLKYSIFEYFVGSIIDTYFFTKISFCHKKNNVKLNS